MVWLGKIIQKYVKLNVVVLDLGCGIIKSTDILEIIDKDKYSSFTRKNAKSFVSKILLKLFNVIIAWI